MKRGNGLLWLLLVWFGALDLTSGFMNPNPLSRSFPRYARLRQASPPLSLVGKERPTSCPAGIGSHLFPHGTLEVLNCRSASSTCLQMIPQSLSWSTPPPTLAALVALAVSLLAVVDGCRESPLPMVDPEVSTQIRMLPMSVTVKCPTAESILRMLTPIFSGVMAVTRPEVLAVVEPETVATLLGTTLCSCRLLFL